MTIGYENFIAYINFTCIDIRYFIFINVYTIYFHQLYQLMDIFQYSLSADKTHMQLLIIWTFIGMHTQTYVHNTIMAIANIKFNIPIKQLVVVGDVVLYISIHCILLRVNALNLFYYRL